MIEFHELSLYGQGLLCISRITFIVIQFSDR